MATKMETETGKGTPVSEDKADCNQSIDEIESDHDLDQDASILNDEKSFSDTSLSSLPKDEKSFSDTSLPKGNRKRRKKHEKTKRENRKKTKIITNTVNTSPRTRQRKCRQQMTPRTKRKNKEQDAIHKKRCRTNETPRSKEKRLQLRRTAKAKSLFQKNPIEKLIADFKAKIKEGPTYVCVVCHRLLYRKSVKGFIKDKYKNLKQEKKAKLFMDDYMIKSNDGNLWICHTCNMALHQNRIPAQANVNGLSVNKIPEELSDLNPLESRMIARRIPFVKLLALPRGRQKAINGPVVNVPANIEKICDFLPRIPGNANIIGLKLKRRLKYKGHYMHQFIRPNKISEAIQYLHTHNKLYSDVTLNTNWEKDWADEDREMWESLIQANISFEENELSIERQDGNDVQVANENDNTSLISTQDIENEDADDQTELDLSSKLRGLPFATLLTPENFNPDTDITSIAPSEDEKPRSILLDDDFEALAFPALFTGETGTLSTKREVKLSARKYFNQRLLNFDGRFAKDIDYLLAAQYATEHKQVIDDISIMLRQRKGTGHGNEVINAGKLRQGNCIENMIKDDKAYRCLKNVRGSPSYWSLIQHEAMSMIRQLGKPTWFLTLSAADMQWPEVIRSIAFQYNINYTDDDVKEMSWDTKCEWLRNNPVTVARNFHHRLDIFFKEFILSKSNPIGEIVDYIIRIEFQARGSPHAHTILWARDAPKMGIQSDEEVIEYVDKYQTCKLPDEQDDPELASLVRRLQTHVHSASCRKTHSHCRFHFPHPPSVETIIAREVENEEDMNAAKSLLGKVHDIISDKEMDKTLTIEMLCESADVNMEQYFKALHVSNRGTNLVLKRSVEEININNYNPAILKAWQANMDLSYIVDAYACVMYVVSYVLKQERTMGDLLRRVAKEYQDSDLQVQLRKTGAAFLNNREVSAQEAVYRILSIPLKQSSRKVVFINTNPKQNRVVMLKPTSMLENLEDEDEDVVQKSLIDKYAARPDHLEHLSLAEFGAWYTYSNKQDKDDCNADENEECERTKIKLKGGLGTMSKRKREAVIRFSSLKGSKNEDLKLRGKIMLYIPWRSEEKDIDGIESYTDYANQMSRIIDEKEKLFTKVERDFDDHVQRLEEEGVPSHVWDNIAPHALQNEGDDETEGAASERCMVLEDIEANENLVTGKTKPSPLEARVMFEKNRSVMSSDEYRAAFQTLNTTQKEAVSFNRNWCVEAVAAMRSGKSPKPYHIFLSGPGGVGKSHVIKLVHNDVTNIFRQSGLLEPSEIPVLVTGPTGTSAFAIGGLTLHATFLFSTYKNQYQPLSSDRLNTLRCSLGKLQVLIIDEVSMVGSEMLYAIHKRLEEIKGLKNDNSRFGNISILAVGDLLQLRPVKQGTIFNLPMDPYARLHGSLWTENFKLIELTEIMRQKDDQPFAELLNKVRNNDCSVADISILRNRSIEIGSKEYEELDLSSALHLFATNKLVDKHNENMIARLGVLTLKIPAIDSTKDEQSRQLLVTLPDKPSDTGGLRAVVEICERARVMLTYNVDVSDGLVNGANGRVKGIVKDNDHVKVILVDFDNKSVGISARANSPYQLEFPQCVPVTRIEAVFMIGRRKNAEVTRKQFPLTLSWAQTIHKVQGQTVPRVVIDMSGRFTAGQAYVAFSRVTKLDGLYVTNFDPKKIKADDTAIQEMERMRKHSKIEPPISNLLLEKSNILRIAHLNICSVSGKWEYLTKEDFLHHMDIICLSETWLQPSVQLPDNCLLKDAVTYRKDRSQVSGLETVGNGGVLTIVKNHLHSTELSMNFSNLEVVTTVVRYECTVINVVCVYRKPGGISMESFIDCLKMLLQKLADGPTILLGDFNCDTISKKKNHLVENLKKEGFDQIIDGPTTIRGTCIDHIYCKNVRSVCPEIHDCFYSDHRIVATGIVL